MYIILIFPKKKSFSYGDIVSIAKTYKYLNKRFFSLLNYSVFPKILSQIKPYELYIWHENQFHQRSLLLSLANNSNSLKFNSLKIYTNVGVTFSQEIIGHT